VLVEDNEINKSAKSRRDAVLVAGVKTPGKWIKTEDEGFGGIFGKNHAKTRMFSCHTRGFVRQLGIRYFGKRIMGNVVFLDADGTYNSDITYGSDGVTGFCGRFCSNAD